MKNFFCCVLFFSLCYVAHAQSIKQAYDKQNVSSNTFYTPSSQRCQTDNRELKNNQISHDVSVDTEEQELIRQEEEFKARMDALAGKMNQSAGNNSDGMAGNSTTGAESGVAGNPNGSGNSGNEKGNPGNLYGNGDAVNLVKPTNTQNCDNPIVLTVTVNSQGKVVDIKKIETALSEQSCIEAAKDAARKTTFQPDSKDIRYAKITYEYTMSK